MQGGKCPRAHVHGQPTLLFCPLCSQYETPSLPDLAISVVLFHSPLEQFRELLDSLIAAAVRANLAQLALVCVDNRPRPTLCDAVSGVV